MAKIMNLVHSEKVEGREKPIHTKVGILMVKDDGRMSIKLNFIPVNFNGWLNVYEQQDRSEPEAF